jgi:exodeoxyribonuclease-3
MVVYILKKNMRIISYNVNGIRSAITKGLLEWLATDPADIICFQELKSAIENIPTERFEALGYHCYWFPAQKKGYSGVGIISKIAPESVVYGNTFEQSNMEGRVLLVNFNDFTLISAYFPSGSSGEDRQTYKYQWLDEFFEYINELKQEGKPLVVCGDYNICHKEIDIHNPKSNKDTSGFLPEERAWMDKWFDNGFVDTFRAINPDPHHYSWWSFRANARANNKGWRIDYISVSKEWKDKIEDAAIYPDVKHSDHCPVYVSLNLN